MHKAKDARCERATLAGYRWRAPERLRVVGFGAQGGDAKDAKDWGKKQQNVNKTDVIAKASNPWVAGMTTDERAKVLKSVKG